jgi:hypothetical protein
MSFLERDRISNKEQGIMNDEEELISLAWLSINRKSAILNPLWPLI